MSKESKIKKLQKENDRLVQNVLDKIAVIKELENDYASLTNDYIRKVNELHQARSEPKPKAPQIPLAPKKVKYDRHYTLSFELNPFKWFSRRRVNYYRYDWKRTNSEAREGQADFGPISFSWYRDRV